MRRKLGRERRNTALDGEVCVGPWCWSGKKAEQVLMMECETTAFNVCERQRRGCQKKFELTNITEPPCDRWKRETSRLFQTSLFTLYNPPCGPQADVFNVNDVITYSETIALAYCPRQ